MKTIKKRNQEFNKMSAANKRIAVAKDVIKQLSIGKYKAAESNYGTFYKHGGLMPWANSDKSFKESVCDDKSVLCSACAKGTLLISYVSKVNDFKLKDFGGIYGNSDSHLKLKELFSHRQLALIEGCFEGVIMDHELASDKYEKISEKYHDKYPDSEKRLIAIMRNIIRNNGTFRP